MHSGLGGSRRGGSASRSRPTLSRLERDFLTEVIYEVMEDVALGRAIAEGKDDENVERDEIFAFL